MQRFEQQVVIVTGAGSGIGQATALAFAAEGARLVVVDINAQTAAATAAQIGPPALAIAADVAEESAWVEIVAQTLAAFGRIDVLFNNAGIGGGPDRLVKLDVALWDRMLAVNLRSIFLGCKHVLPAMAAGGGGAIVNMSSSTAGWDVIYGGGAYMASKQGVNALTCNFALEAAEYGVRVNAVCPGIIRTRLSSGQAGRDDAAEAAFFDHFQRRIPLRRVGEPADVAGPVLFFASDAARHITGSLLLIDGGQTLQSWSNAPNEPFDLA